MSLPAQLDQQAKEEPHPALPEAGEGKRVGFRRGLFGDTLPDSERLYHGSPSTPCRLRHAGFRMLGHGRRVRICGNPG